MNYAVVNESNQVVNVVVWNGDVAIWQPPSGYLAIQLEPGKTACIGWSYDPETENFLAP
jgi:hypothetical protein